jgi:catechol 2,3-dioxygenase-like lactoylglutathione lyase family enzyme
MGPTPGLSFSHMGFYVHDLEMMGDFYTGMLDFTVTDRGTLPRVDGSTVEIIFLSRDPDEHHQIILAGGRPETLAFNPINQISLKADSLETLVDFHRRFREQHPHPMDTISHGNAVSIYVPDPEGNRLELYWPTPWYVSQPLRESIDLILPIPELMATVQRQAEALPGYKTRAEWRAEMVERMDQG